MRKKILFSMLIFAVLFAGACKSKPAPVVDNSATRVPTVGTTTPTTTTPAATTPTTTTPTTESGTAYGTGTGTVSGGSTVSGSVGSRHRSGIILDGATSYTVQRGDTMSGIARQLYRDGSLYPLIMMVSDAVSDIDEIEPGMRLTIPVVSVNMNDPTARQSINSYFPQIASIEDQRGRHNTASLIRRHTR